MIIEGMTRWPAVLLKGETVELSYADVLPSRNNRF